MDVGMNCVNLVITGNPGVGKHTIADLFIKHDSSYQIFDINKFVIEKEFAEQVDGGIEVDTGKLKDEIQKLNLNKSLIVGHLAPYVLDQSDINFAIILRKNPYDLIEVYKKRKYKNSKIKENSGSEILGVIANDSITSFGKEKSFEIDATNKTPEIILEQIHNIINNQKGGDMVDWLRLVEEKNEINKFFDY
jgi:adenylate kinase|tara:strand:+ start:196 stop:771 length:576 start_codon:yes stop_codon:yes gene_type:complete